MGLLSGDGAALLHSIFSPLYLEGVIITRETIYEEGGDTTIIEMEWDCRLQVDAMNEAMRGESGAADTDRRIIILRNSTEAPAVNTDCEVAALEGPYAGQRYQVATIDADPCGSYWSCRGRRSGS